ncbi:18912_t:CDS:1 [Acaulospora morrowiae]|uniref:18912_t:CDS:1 n=1 Tax=Acaulospora morrowiae TaxID=94023 RepID=A0A9N9C169_9GLOM|nr:18912_t:CDS:1 [Acaulospora morrowiae]
MRLSAEKKGLNLDGILERTNPYRTEFNEFKSNYHDRRWQVIENLVPKEDIIYHAKILPKISDDYLEHTKFFTRSHFSQKCRIRKTVFVEGNERSLGSAETQQFL